MNLNLTGFGYAGENFSVDREKERLLKENVVKKSYSVLLTDNSNRKFGKNDKEINHINCYREPMAKELYDWLIENKMKDLGIKESPKKALIHIYIIDKG